MDAADLSPAFLEAHRIPGLPRSFYYIPNLITEAEEELLLSKINNPISSTPWITLRHRRLQAHPARLTANNTLLSTTSLAPWLSQPCLPRLEALSVFKAEVAVGGIAVNAGPDNKDSEDREGWERNSTPHASPNHCLINEYTPSQGIMPHEDGDAYAGVVATVTLGAVGVLEVYEKEALRAGDEEGGKEEAKRHRRPKWRILQEERSLLVTRGVAYRDLLHGIAEVDVDEGLWPDGQADGAGISDGREGLERDRCDKNEPSGSDGQRTGGKADGDRATATSPSPGIVNWDLLADAERFTTAGGRMPRGTRVSLTWRDVLKVSKVGQRLFGRPR